METITILSLALGLGILHAFDADHIMAVTGLAATRADKKDCRRFCSRWAMGHGLAILLIGGSVILLGMAIPEALSAQAEALVGVVLICLAAWVLWDISSRRLSLQADQATNTQYRTEGHNTSSNKRRGHDHSALFIGLLHGTAGAAPFLLLLPLTGKISPLINFTYIFIFCLGVLFSMLFFGRMMGGLYEWLGRYGEQVINALRLLVAVFSALFGLHLLGAF